MSRAELYAGLWPGTFVTDNNLASLVAELRRALDDSSATPRFIRTVHRFGYAFCGEIDGEAAAPARPGGVLLDRLARPRRFRCDAGENTTGRDAGRRSVRMDAPSVSRRHVAQSSSRRRGRPSRTSAARTAAFFDTSR